MARVRKILLFIIIFFTSFMVIATSEENQTFEITLPQKTAGIEKLEYIINDEPKGSTAGKEKITVPEGVNLRFLVKFENEGYNKNLLGNITFKTESKNLKLKIFSYTTTNKIIEKDTSEDEFIDPSQTYVSEVLTVGKNEKIELSNLEKDTFTAKIDAATIPDPNALRIIYQNEKGENLFAKYKVSTKEFIIENLNFNSALKFGVELEPAYSNSDVKFVLGNTDIAYDILSKTWIAPVQNDFTLKLLGVEKNKYDINFKNSDISFKYRKIGEESWTTESKNFSAIYEESYAFMCGNLDGKEVTVNGNIILPNSENVYFLSNIKENIEIDIKNSGSGYYPIYFPDDKDLIFKNNLGQIQKTAQVSQGDSYTFELDFSEAFEEENCNALIYAVPENIVLNSICNNVEMPDLGAYLLQKNNNQYTIENIKEPLKVIVKNANKKKIDITLPLEYQGAKFIPVDSFDTSDNLFHIDYGTDFSFTVDAPNDIDTTNIKFLNNGYPIDIWNIGNIYTLKNVQSNITLLPEALPSIKYKIDFSGENLIFKSANEDFILKSGYATSADNLEFKIEPKEGYKIRESGLNVYVSSGSAIISKTDETYKINNLSEDSSIIAEGMEIKMVTVTLQENSIEEGETTKGLNYISPETGEPLPTEITVPYGSPIYFETTPKNTESENLQPTVETEIIASNESNVFAVYALKDMSVTTSEATATGNFWCSLSRNGTCNWDGSYRDIKLWDLSLSNSDNAEQISDQSINLSRSNLKNGNQKIYLRLLVDYVYQNPVNIVFSKSNQNIADPDYRVTTSPKAIKREGKNAGYFVIEYDFSDSTLSGCNVPVNTDAVLQNVTAITLQTNGVWDYHDPKIKYTTENPSYVNSQIYLPAIVHNEKCKGWESGGAPGFYFHNDRMVARDFKFFMWPNAGKTLPDEFLNFGLVYDKGNGVHGPSGSECMYFMSEGNAVGKGTVPMENGDGKGEGTPYTIRMNNDGLFEARNKLCPEGGAGIDRVQKYFLKYNFDTPTGYWCKVVANENQGGGDNHGKTNSNFVDMLKISHPTNGNRQYFATQSNGSLVIKVDVSDPLYELGNPKVECFVSGVKQRNVTISATETPGNYKISNISGHAVIKISGITRIKRKVNLAPITEGITLYSMQGQNKIPNELWVTDDESGDFFSKASFGYTFRNATASWEPKENIQSGYPEGVNVVAAGESPSSPGQISNYTKPYIDDKTKTLIWRISKLKIDPTSSNLITTVTIANFFKRKFKVDFFSTGADFLRYGSPVTQQDLNYQEEMEFTINAKPGYDISKATLVMVGEDKIEHPLTEQHTYKDPAQGNEEVTFTGAMTTPNPDLPTGSSGTRLRKKEGSPNTFILENVSEDITLQLKNIQKLKRTVTLPTFAEGINFYTGAEEKLLNPDETTHDVWYGDSFIFKMRAKEGYNLENITVTANNVPIDLIDGVYTLKNITENTSVSIAGTKHDTRNIKLNYKNGVTFKDPKNVEYSTVDPISVKYHEDFAFQIILSEEYLNSQNIKVICKPEPTNNPLGTTEPVVDENGDTIPGSKILRSNSRGIYTIYNVQQDYEIEVIDISQNQYNINLIKQKNMFKFVDRYNESTEFSDVEVKNYGENFSFTLKPAEGVNLEGASVYAKPSGLGDKIKLTSIDGVYTLSNIMSDYTITVEDIQKVKHKVDFRLVEGISCLDTRGNSLPLSVEIEHGNTLSFKLSKDEAYSKANPKVIIKGLLEGDGLKPNENTGIYTTPEINDNIIIEILDVKKNTYKARFKIVEGVMYRTERNKEIETVDPENSNFYFIEVEYDTSFNFKVVLKDAYNESIPYVEMNNSRQLIAVGDKYELKNLKDDTDINVKNVVKNPADITREDVDKFPLPSDISTQSNIDEVVRVSLAYKKLSDEQKKMVSNVTELQNAQKAVGKIYHRVGDIAVEGVEWYAKLTVTPLSDNTEKIEYMNGKLQNKSVISLYELKLWNVLTNESYEVPYGQKVSVSLPAPDLTGYRNVVVVHETSAGGIEILDINILNNQASFETTSFGTLFGIAAKKVPNYTEKASDVTIALPENVSEDEVFKLLNENLVSKLGDLTKDTTTLNGTNNSLSEDGTSTNEKAWYTIIYNWALENELWVVMIILGIGSIWAITLILRKKATAE